MADNKLTQTEVSLNPASGDLVNIKVNGIAVKVPKNENVIESARRAGVDIPYFCYHPRLSKGDAANCRMCLVDVAMPRKMPDGTVTMALMPKPQTSCTLPAAEGMEIMTETERVVKDRKGVLEFLLINHPLDCPICDRGGECPLQNNTLFYGASASRYIEEKRHYPKAYPLSHHVVFDRERCIQCARCTRFSEDISGDAQLALLKRGADVEVGTFAHTEYRSRFSGNVIELCPVGALLSRDYRFKARPWDLQTQASVCTRCSNGCNVKLDIRLDALQRVNARLNEDVNEEWTCDKGKFGHDYVSAATRLTSPMLKKNGGWTSISWQEAYSLLITKLKAAGSNSGGIGGGRLTNEDCFTFQKLFREGLNSNNLDSRLGRNQGPAGNPVFERLGYHTMGSSIADLENMKTILLFGTELAEEQPIIYLRVRKTWRFKNASVINAVTSIPKETTTAADFAAVNLVYKPGTEVALLNGLLQVLFAEKLLPSESASTNFSALEKSVAGWTLEKTSEVTGVAVESIAKAARLLATGPLAIIAGKAVSEHPYYADVVNALANLGVVTGSADRLNFPLAECNSQGAQDMGLLPDSGPGYKSIASPGLNTQGMLEAAVAGKLELLWFAGADLVKKYHDPALATRALEACPFVVVNELEMTETAKLADLVLPAASFAEKDGTYTSCERRIQRIHKAFDPMDDVRADWVIFTEIASNFAGSLPSISPKDILRDIAMNAAPYADVTLQDLGEGGVRWSYPEERGVASSVTPVEFRS